MAVVGQGERKHPPGGNALLTTQSIDGNDIKTFLWMEQFATDLNLQLDSVQVKKGLTHRPIRLSERFLNFTTLWTVAQRQEYLDFIEKIKNHWARNLNEDRPTPMKLQYYGANKTWLGFIENASVGYAVPDVILRYSFQMRILPVQTDRISIVQGSSPIAPTTADLQHWGSEWYTMAEFNADVIGVGNEGASGAKGGRGNNEQTTSDSGEGHKR
jgi:hypothetical protein